jgi:hypothetical protein
MKPLSLLAASLLAMVMSSPAYPQAAPHVPLVRLLATPDAYNGKTISVSGILGRVDGGGLAIFLDQGSEQNDITSNAFRLLLSETAEGGSSAHDAVGKYVIVSGVFDVASPQSRIYSGLLRDVSRVRPYPLLLELPADGTAR